MVLTHEQIVCYMVLLASTSLAADCTFLLFHDLFSAEVWNVNEILLKKLTFLLLKAENAGKGLFRGCNKSVLADFLKRFDNLNKA